MQSIGDFARRNQDWKLLPSELPGEESETIALVFLLTWDGNGSAAGASRKNILQNRSTPAVVAEVITASRTAKPGL